MESNEQKPLIAEKLCNPLILLWTMLLPQSVLLLINLSSWNIIKGEVAGEQQKMLLVVFVYQLLLLVISLAVSSILHTIRKKLNLAYCAFLLLCHIGYLWLITAWLDKLLPDSVTIWILTPGEVIYYQYILMMPAIFYTGLRLSCFPSPLKKVTDISFTVGILITVPLCSYIFTTVLSGFFWRWDIPTVMLIITFVTATIITMMAFLRTLTYIYLGLSRYQAGHIVLLFAVGLVGPLGGLALNSKIPFPCDFQSSLVYVLALINGCILILCVTKGSKEEIWGWFFRCLMYPFSLYFFLVFLPFLPLALLAMIAMGSGFLILAPTALFIVHTQKLLDEGKRVTQALGTKATLGLFTIAFAVMPVIFIARALSDKHSLMKAIDAAYNTDYRNASKEIDSSSVKRSLLKLRDMKNGIFLPFISNAYNKIVFNGMVLPDRKMNEMYWMFFGQEMPKDDSFREFMWGRPRNFRNTSVTLPDRNVALEDITVTENAEGPFTQAHIQLKLKNHGRSQSEFVTEIQLDPGVMVSGYWLEIDNEKIAGHVFEKKAAMWVYHMIRDFTRRDPGLLVYKTDQILKLSVYPFEQYQTRLTGIELLYPTGTKPLVKIGNQQLELNTQDSSEFEDIFIIPTDSGNTAVILPRKAFGALPSIQRKPYLHFILDCSVNAKEAFPSFSEQMTQFAENCATIDTCKITLANYESKDVTSNLISIKNIDTEMKNAAGLINFQGGFCYSRAIKQKLLSFHSAMSEGSDQLLSVPIFVVLKASDQDNGIEIEDMSLFGDITPDISCYYIVKNDGTLISKTFDGEETYVSSIQSSSPVALLKYEDSIAACLPLASCGLVTFVGTGNPTLNVYDPETKRFDVINNSHILERNSTYAKGLEVWNKYRQTVYHPNRMKSELPELVRMSKDCGVIVPSTSYIVLENTAQLEILKRKEKQGLNANQALEFDEFMESPAPPTWLLAPVVILLLLKIPKKRSAGERSL